MWQPALCIHSKNCVRGLPGVFNFERRPWIDPRAASSEAMERQVEPCPSGALGYFRNAGLLAASADNARATAAEEPVQPAQVRVEVKPGGPLIVTGALDVLFPDGRTEQHPRTALCRCGQSANKPYCDGAYHRLPPGWDPETSAARPA
ncbi:(4Fe-4S)-binding protein [Hymenobacter sp. J193]|nr:(4Fe-4S)-binding protein [Hymenobacter sp. J193]MCR5888646.1 (4Fe-4S)-binding protein [Hymenobacter sp. J193]